MRVLTAVLILSLGVALTRATTGSASVIAAAATSSAAHSSPVNCLLAPGCAGAWSPGSGDSGANEGVYIQFETVVEIDAIELTTNVKDTNAAFTVSINGAVATRRSVKPASEAGRYAVRYAVSGNRAKSVFFRLGVQKGGWAGFQLYSIRFLSQGKAVDLTLPVPVPASVTATSVLEPKVAYQPANLFDSRYDFAWSINGQTSKGKGESVEIKFSRPQNLTAMLVWNGYQRSDVHFKANGRVTRVVVNDGTSSNSLALADKMGSQRIAFANPFRNALVLKLTIEEVVSGAKYPDVLISELRFIDDQNRILIPQVQGITPASSPLIGPLLDKSLSSVVCHSSFTPGNFQRSLRLRKDGSFVIYGKDNDEEKRKKTDQVLEGNWELRDSGIRIFGKRYSNTIVRSAYSQATRRTPPSIFQSDLKIAKFGELTAAEQQELVALIWTRIAPEPYWGQTEDPQVEIEGIGGVTLARGTDEKTLLANLVRTLRGMNPWTVSSPIVEDVFMFSDDVGACATTP